MRIVKDGTKMARLDRFLISKEILDKFPNLMPCPMERKYYDHCHILVKQEAVDYRPISFILFHSWLDDPKFDSILKNNWGIDGVSRGPTTFF